MANFQKIIAILISLAILAGLFYFLLNGKNVLEVVFPNPGIRDFASNILEKGRTLIDPLISPVIQKSENVANELINKAKDKVDEAFSEARSNAVESVKKTVNKKIDEVTGNTDLKPTQVASIGSVSIGNNLIKAPENSTSPLGFSVKKNQPAIFIIKNEGNINMNFQIDWGDAKNDNGDLEANKSKTFFHIWDNVGEYLIKTVTVIGADKKTYSSYILVYP